MFENIKVGDIVILESGPPYSCRYSYEKVEKITPKGYIKVKGMLFYQNGTQRTNDKWNYCSIYEKDNERIVKILNERRIQHCINKIKQKLNAFSEKQWTLEISNKVEAFLNEIEEVK